MIDRIERMLSAPYPRGATSGGVSPADLLAGPMYRTDALATWRLVAVVCLVVDAAAVVPGVVLRSRAPDAKRLIRPRR